MNKGLNIKIHYVFHNIMNGTRFFMKIFIRIKSISININFNRLKNTLTWKVIFYGKNEPNERNIVNK